MKIPCFSCNTSCCSQWTILVNFRDVVRISHYLGLQPSEFTDPVPLQKDYLYYGPYSFSLGDKKRFLLALKEQKNGCIFLLKIGKRENRCGIHHSRPSVCRAHPFSLERGRVKEVENMLCPSSWELSEKEKKPFAGHITEMKKDYHSHFAMVNSWHSKILPDLKRASPKEVSSSKVFKIFLNFLMEKAS